MTTATYLVGEPNTVCRCVSLVTDPAHLWDEATGISTNPQQRGRRGERPVTVEWLSPERSALGFSVPAGLGIHRNSRIEQTQPSSRSDLYFREEYGPRELTHPLFGKAAGADVCSAGPASRGSGQLAVPHGAPSVRQEAVYVRDQR